MDRRVRKVVEIIDTRWRMPLRVDELARIVGLGASRLEHLFKEEARVSIRDFIHERRLREAAQMLASTEERVSVISFHVGFQHVSNFNHAFKKRFGVSPGKYRQEETDASATAETTK
jgi:AraC family transcriptional regulator, arabinose operon regulatory protein